MNLARYPGACPSHLSSSRRICLQTRCLRLQWRWTEPKGEGAESLPGELHGHPQTWGHIALVTRLTASDCFLERKLNSSQHIYHLVTLPGCWQAFENCGFFNLNIRMFPCSCGGTLKWKCSWHQDNLWLRWLWPPALQPLRCAMFSLSLACCLQASVSSAVWDPGGKPGIWGD